MVGSGSTHGERGRLRSVCLWVLATAVAGCDRIAPVARTLEYRLEVRVIGAFDLPVAGVPVYATPMGLRPNLIGTSDGTGTVRVRWIGKCEQTMLVVSACGLVTGQLYPVPARAGEVAQCVLRIGDASLGAGPDPFLLAPHMVDRAAEPVGFAEGRFEPYLERGSSRKDALGLVSPTVWSGPTAKLRGTVRTQSGERLDPPPRIWVWPVGGNVVDGCSAECAPDGAFELQAVPSGPVHVHAGGGDQPAAATELVLAPGSTGEWHAHVDDERSVEGTVEVEGASPAGLLVVVECGEAGHVTWADMTHTDFRGRFRVRNLRAEPTRLLLFAGVSPSFPFHEVRIGGRSHLDVRAPNPEVGALWVTVEAEEGRYGNARRRPMIQLFGPCGFGRVGHAASGPPGRYAVIARGVQVAQARVWRGQETLVVLEIEQGR